MPGPPPKNPRTRQRRNKTSTRAVLAPSVEAPVDVPVASADVPPAAVVSMEPHPLPPGRPWHEMTRLWWSDVWRSEMRDEYLRVDVHRLFMLAVLVDEFWLDPSPDAHKEVRLAGQCFGLTPLDRRRLQWETKRAPEDRLRQPQATNAPAHPKPQTVDPRKLLSMVKPA